MHADMRVLSADEMGARVKHHFLGDLVYAKQISLKKGEVWGTHAHPTDHMSILAKGRVSLLVGDATTEYGAPAYILIAKGKRHGIAAMEDSEWFCTWATEETDSEKIDASILGERHAA